MKESKLPIISGTRRKYFKCPVHSETPADV